MKCKKLTEIWNVWMESSSMSTLQAKQGPLHGEDCGVPLPLAIRQEYLLDSIIKHQQM